MRDAITRTRNKQNNFVPNFTEDIPVELRQDLRGEMFFRYDSGINDESRIIIFATKYKEGFICKTNTWLIDGTFKTAPLGFYQILTIHGYFLGRSYPLIYIFLKNKTEMIYTKAFIKIFEMFNSNPKYIILDFEKALINAAEKVFQAQKFIIVCFILVNPFGDGYKIKDWSQNIKQTKILK